MNVRKRTAAKSAALLASAALAGVGSTQAQDASDLESLTKPESSVEAGVGLLGKDAPRLGQYTGIRERGGYGMLDILFSRRDDATGRWLEFSGRNLGLDNRELRFDHGVQGNWRYFVEFSQTPRFHPYVVSTSMANIDSRFQRESGTVRRDVRFETVREALAAGFEKKLGGGFDFSVRFRNEEKNGLRQWGRATVRFLVDPVDYQTQQLEATAGYSGDKLQLSAGYHASSFQNQNLFVRELAGGGNDLVALPPGNQAHQLSLSGGYSFTPTTRAMFKVAYGRATQGESFFSPRRAGVTRTDLDGRIDTTQAQIGISSRPLPKLSLRADLRHEKRIDRTPVEIYTTFAAGTSDGTNEPRSFTTTVGKLEASYALPMGFRVTGGADIDHRWRNTSRIRTVSFRDTTDEAAYRLELRRSLGETLNGAVSYVSSKRTGGQWQTNIRLDNTVGSNLIHPINLADRDRDKIKLVLDWAPLDPLSVNFTFEDSRDAYRGRVLGVRDGTARMYALDAALTVAEGWQLTAWLTRNDTRIAQVTCEEATTAGVCANTTTDPIWEAKLRNLGNALGVGVRGKATGMLEVGADLSLSADRGVFHQAPVTRGTVAGTVPTIPDVNFRRTNLSVYGQYALGKSSGVRLRYAHDRFRTDDWYMANFAYADGTVVSQNPNQKVDFIGASYFFHFR